MYNQKKHIIIVIVGVIIGLALGFKFLEEMGSHSYIDIIEEFKGLGETIPKEDAIRLFQMEQTTTKYAPAYLVGSIFSGIYTYCYFIKDKANIIKILSVCLFPIVFALASFFGMITLIPMVIYDIYVIIKTHLVKRL